MYFVDIVRFSKTVSKKGALFNNGDCMEMSSFETGYSSGKIYYEGKTTLNYVDSTGIAVSIFHIEIT